MGNTEKLTIVIEPDPILHQISKEVESFDENINNLLDKMAEIMEKFDGLGLAAPQVGILQRIIIIDAEIIANEEKKPLPKTRYLKIINPTVLEVSKKTCTIEEGCLSLPAIYYSIERPEEISIEYFDEQGKKHTLKANGLLARCIQHEIDHLNGKIFTDYTSSLKRKLALTKLKKIKSRM